MEVHRFFWTSFWTLFVCFSGVFYVFDFLHALKTRPYLQYIAAITLARTLQDCLFTQPGQPWHPALEMVMKQTIDLLHLNGMPEGLSIQQVETHLHFLWRARYTTATCSQTYMHNWRYIVQGSYSFSQGKELIPS